MIVNNKSEQTSQHPMHDGKPIKSIMKVRTIHESIKSTRRKKRTTKRSLFRWKIHRECDEQENHVKDCISETTHSTSSSSLSSSTSTEPKRKTKQLTFHNVEVREYELVPGCNPSITDLGPPVELGWRSSEAIVYSIDQYEKSRCDLRCDVDLLRMPACVRHDLLLVHGNDEASIWEATEEAYRTNRQREETAALERMKRIQEDKKCNPSITDLGPPVELGWRSSEAVVYSLDQYEKSRCDLRCDVDLLRMPACVRHDLLLFHGNAVASIWEATEEAYRTNRQREETAALERMKRIQEDKKRNKLFKMIDISSMLSSVLRI
eukprot:CAMPEP_0204641852 /NCGR_PEP_ID=MMETSP0717-20131115/51363_1 /ASSEMBLY_ACC=CAM_ASM_000666 /TAXON_ID=230516 /ORGANISM="Chaetoceros curvisetus" /LENGTH=320 /DNA_ID=CAMNT_0051662563 /DNA_START=71 /DNA_END=1034 /DNA_ORIENTATION=+